MASSPKLEIMLQKKPNLSLSVLDLLLVSDMVDMFSTFPVMLPPKAAVVLP